MADEKTEGMAGQGAASKTPNTPGGLPSQAGIPSQTTGAPALAGAPVSAPPPATEKPMMPAVSFRPPEQKMGDDIAKILSEVKIPARREPELAAEKPPQKEVKDIDALLRTERPATPAPEAMAPGAAAAQEKSSVQSLHTLKQDLQHVVQEQKISVVRAVALEEDRRAAKEEIEPIQSPQVPRTHRVKNVFFASALLILLGAAAFGGVYFVMLDRAEKLPEPVSDSLVFAERTVTLGLDDQSPTQLKKMLENARTASTAALGAITRIVPIKQSDDGSSRPATFAEFLASIGAKPPDQLSRSLGSNFFFGLHTIDKNAPLLVIPVVSYDNAFAGMLAWETSMNAELAPLYLAVPALIAGQSGIPERRTFQDEVMRNYDVRALRDDSGAIVLYYAFPTRNLLVIAESPYTFTELLARLQAQRSL